MPLPFPLLASGVGALRLFAVWPPPSAKLTLTGASASFVRLGEVRAEGRVVNRRASCCRGRRERRNFEGLKVTAHEG